MSYIQPGKSGKNIAFIRPAGIIILLSIGFLFYSCGDKSAAGDAYPDQIFEINQWIKAGRHYESIHEIDSALMDY